MAQSGQKEDPAEPEIMFKLQSVVIVAITPLSKKQKVMPNSSST